MIVAEELSKFYGGRRALDHVSFEIQSNEVVGFLGLNGAGKTTCLKILSGLLLPSTGRVRIDGLDLLERPREVRRHIGFLPEQPPLYLDQTVRQYLHYAGRLNGVSAGEISRRIEEVVEATQLAGVADDMISWLSEGYRQRVGIAQAIIHRPALVILDEPFTDLDPEQIVGMRGLIRSLAEHHTVLLSSHMLGEIHQTCDRILVLHEGRIVAQGSESEMSARAAAARLRVVVRGDAQIAEKTVAGVAGVSGVQVEAGPESVVAIVADVANMEAREALARALVEAGLGVRLMHEAEAGLESVFLQITSAAATGGSPRTGGEA